MLRGPFLNCQSLVGSRGAIGTNSGGFVFGFGGFGGLGVVRSVGGIGGFDKGGACGGSGPAPAGGMLGLTGVVNPPPPADDNPAPAVLKPAKLALRAI